MSPKRSGLKRKKFSSAPPPAPPVARVGGSVLRSTTVGGLPMVNEVLRRIRLEEFLRDALPKEDGRTKLSPVKALLVLLRNLLVSREPIYGLGEWAVRYAPGLLALASVKWQRCQFHMAKSLIDHVPSAVSQREISGELQAVFNAPNRAEADWLLDMMVHKYAEIDAKLAAWLENNVPEGRTVFDFPVEHRRQLRTNNCLERLNREIKRRKRVATLFPNEASLLRLATAVLMEMDEDWQAEKRYLPRANA